MPASIQPVRRMHHLPSTDRPVVRHDLMYRVRTEVRGRGAVVPALMYFDETFVDELSLTRLLAEDPGAHIGATWHALADRPEVEHAFLVVEAQGHETTRGNQAVILQKVPEGWWLALMGFDVDPRTGLGIPDDWKTLTLRHVEQLPDALQPFAEPPADAVPAPVGDPVEPPSRIYRARGELDEDVLDPDDATSVVDAMWRVGADAFLAGHLDVATVICQRGREVQVWQLGEDLPAPLEEMVRKICTIGGPAEAVGLMRPVIAGDRLLLSLIVEHRDVDVRGWDELERSEGGVGFTLRGEPTFKEWSRPAGDAGWLGVRPALVFEMWPAEAEAAVDGPGRPTR